MDAWQFIEHQEDLVQVYMNRLEALSQTGGLPRDAEEQAMKKMTIDFWALLKTRLVDYKLHPDRRVARPANGDEAAQQQIVLAMQRAGEEAARNYETLVACGGAISAGVDTTPTTLMEVSFENLFSAIMTGKGKESEELVWVDGYCRIEGCATAPKKTKVAQCKVCRHCQEVFDAGEDPESLYKHRKQARVREAYQNRQNRHKVAQTQRQKAEQARIISSNDKSDPTTERS